MPLIRTTIRSSLVALGCLVALSACGKPQSFGEANSIIVAVSDSLWPTVEDAVNRSLEPRTFTVRDERIFKVTPTDPTASPWADLRRFQNVLVIGRATDPWVEQALEEASGQIPEPPALVRVEDVWALNQGVMIVLLPPGAGAETAEPLLQEAGERYLEGFQRYAHQRMFASGEDTALSDTLAREAGFSVLVPEVYYWDEIEPGTYIFRNDYPDPATLIRSVLVTSRPSDEVAISPETALEWRAELAQQYVQPPQVTDTLLEATPTPTGPANTVQIQGVWSNPPGGWPAAGPFLTRLVQCPEQGRTYLLDAWLYAPGVSKYEYMLQLEYILNSFECAGAAAGAV